MSQNSPNIPGANSKPAFQAPSPASLGSDQPSVQAQIDSLKAQLDEMIRDHAHNGLDSQLIDFDTSINGLFETVSAAPTLLPKSPYDQVKIYVNGATYRLYWYDQAGNVWHYVTATA